MANNCGDKNMESYVPSKCGSPEIPDKVLKAELEAIHERREDICYESLNEDEKNETEDKTQSESKDEKNETEDKAQSTSKDEKNETEDKTQSASEDEKSKLKDKLVGLALSGGGIRSATFSLGVMQRLAKEGYLKYVDYLSTVSGGGYIGGSLTWLLSDEARKPDWDTSAKLPYGVKDPQKERQRENDTNILKHLRQNGRYLTPGNGITMTSLIAVLLRGILLNFVVWLPLLVAIMVLIMGGAIRHIVETICSIFDAICSWDIDIIIDAICRVFKAILDWIRCVIDAICSWDIDIIIDAICCVIDAICSACSLTNASELGLLNYLAGLLGIVFLIVSILYSLSTRRLTLIIQYLFRRKFESYIRYVLWIGLVFLVLGSIPTVTRLEGDVNEFSIVLLFLLFGIVGGLWAFARSSSNKKGRIPLGVLAPIVSLLFFYGLALVSYELVSSNSEAAWFNCILWLSIVLSILTGVVVNLNYISMHRYYRDRLMEAFMPCPNTDGKPKAAEKADEAELSDMCSKHSPYHLVNTNVVLVDSDNPEWQKRGGDAFLLSPKYCGSTATGWRKTADYMQKDPLTLATAVAISGAAANPNTGAGGVGPTRKPLLSLLMALLNIRLGYWVPNPKSKSQKIANHFRAAFYELSPSGYTECRKLLQISDGGHFENLGVYELVRRKAKLIICCDGSADPEFNFAGLQVLARRIGTDFGARIKFGKFDHLERIIPRDPDPQKVIDRDPDTEAYPVGVKFAGRGYIKGRIIYKCGTKGTLILIKTTMIQGLGLRLKGYKAANSDFPDQSTTDQFFDEEQFEAYRELGYKIADTMISGVNLKGLLSECK